MNRIAGHVGIPPVEVIPNLMSISNINRQKIDKLVSDSSANANRDNNQAPNQQSPTKPLIDLNFDPDLPTQSETNIHRSTDENFNPLLRSSRRKAPPPRRNSVSVVRLILHLVHCLKYPQLLCSCQKILTWISSLNEFNFPGSYKLECLSRENDEKFGHHLCV